ncbi:hypothetical protein CR513_10124, partial [Mucuna pruriens]
MEITKRSSLLTFLLVFVSSLIHAKAYQHLYCGTRGTRCYGKYITCPDECPSSETTDPKTKVCHIDCNKPICRAVCRSRKPNCNAPGSGCYDPRFIGGDGRVFYFHGKSNEHFTLVSDSNLQINARFIGHRPAGRSRDYTWIQALGILFNSQTFSLQATKTAQWDHQLDHLQFTYNGNNVVLPEGPLSTWHNQEKDIKVERVASKNSIMLTLKDVAEILVNVVPITKEDDRIHNYQIPSDDCFAHLEIQLRLFGLSPKVDGVLGRTYRLDFENPAKPGVAMPVVGGEDRYRTNSLLSPECASCVFSQGSSVQKESTQVMEYPTLDCTKFSYGLGIKVMAVSFSRLTFVMLFAIFAMHVNAETQTCTNRRSLCFLKKIPCPAQCPLKSPANPKAKVCYVDCDSPICKSQCKNRKPNCNGPGSACLDPRFVGADGIVFYFHGRSNEDFSLATPSAIWDEEVDHLKLSYDGEELVIQECHPSTWQCKENKLRVERTSNKNSIMVTLPEVVDIYVNVVPVTKEDSRIHNYQIPDNDCFAHLEVQFKFYGLSSRVEGVLGRTYQPNFQNPAKLGVAMPVVGGEDKYRTTSLVSADCSVCIFSPAKCLQKEDLVMEYGMMIDCTGGANSGNGI